MSVRLDPKHYYRLPWNLNDNVLAWLEPTKRCNLSCEGCYSRNQPQWDKSLEQIRADLDVFTTNRRIDSVSITGGDPLMHENIVEIVRIIRDEYSLKPVLNTNGLALTPELTRELKKAGLFGFTFHVDSRQNRPGWNSKSESELNELRFHYADMVAGVGGLSVAFNATVYSRTLAEIPQVMSWARNHIDIVHSMVFILFRTTSTSRFDYYVHGQRIELDDLVYKGEESEERLLSTDDVIDVIRETEPEYSPCAYLGGTRNPQSFKWLIAGRIGTRTQTACYVGPRFMELVQAGHHLLAGRYLAYSHPNMLRHGGTMMFGAAALDKNTRKGAGRYARQMLTHPTRLRHPLRFQSIAIIQPVDTLANGEMNMCDGCPDMTVHNGELVWSCRLEERLRFANFMNAVPKKPDVKLPA